MRHLLCMLLLNFSMALAQKPVILKADLDRVVQENFLGVNAVYHGFAWMPEQIGKGMNNADRGREMERVKAMKLHIARTWYRPDFAGQDIRGPYDWESPHMQALYLWLAEMKKLGVDVALQAAWGFPDDTHLGSKQSDPDQDPLQFAGWVSESIRQIVVKRGYDHVKYLILMTEPTTSPWGKPPVGYELWPYYVRCMKAVQERMEIEGTRKYVQLVGPNNHAVGGTAQLRMSEALHELDGVIDIYSGHTYLPADSGYAGWSNLCRYLKNSLIGSKKPIWIDEYNVFSEWEKGFRQTPQHGTFLAQAVAAFVNAGMQASFIWLLFDQQYVKPLTNAHGSNSFVQGVHRWGLVKWPHDDINDPGLPYPSWYSYAMMSRYLGGGKGTKAFHTENADGVYLAVVQQNSGEWSFLVVNATEAACAATIQINRTLNCSLQRYQYDPASIKTSAESIMITSDKVKTLVGMSFKDQIPAGGVAMYTNLQ